MLEVLIGAVVLLAVASVFIENRYATFSTREASNRASAAQSIRVEVNTSHLWLEERISGDKGIRIASQVYAPLDRAASLCRGLALGGDTPIGGLDRLAQGTAREEATTVCRQISAYRGLTARRVDALAGRREESGLDQALHAAFDDLRAGSAALATAVDRSSRDLETRIDLLDAATVALLVLVFGGVVAIVRRHSRRLTRLAAENQSILDSAGDGVIALDANRGITFANAAAGRLTGYEPAELVSRRAHELIHHTRPDGNPYPVEECPTVASLRDGTVHHVTDEVLWRKDGTSFPAEYTSTPITKDGQVTGAVLIFKDVTDSRRHAERLAHSERLLAQAQELAAIGSWEWDVRTGQVTWSEQLYRIAGLDPDGFKPSFEGFLSTVHPEDQATMETLIEEAVANRESFSTDYRVVQPDGSVRVAHSQGTPRTDESGEVVRMFGIVQDVTYQRKVERMKDEFTSVVSHELRTPLTSVRGSLGLLASGALGPLPEKGQRMADIAVENTDRLVRLINDILDVERIDSRKVTMEKAPCRAAQLIAQAVEVMQAMASERGVRIAVAAEDVPLWADPDRVIQTLTNLLSNAIKFSPSGATVRISSELDSGEALFRVVDEGRGIPSDKLGSIFKRFEQVDASDSREKGGTGLGLPICQSIVQQHGGHIWVESTPGVGSSFSFTLPAEAADASREPGDGDGGGPAVLVCDDDPSVVEVVSALLEQGGYKAIRAATGREAVDRAVAERPDMVLLDLLMPGMSGWETAAALKEREETAAIPVVILSVLSRYEGNGGSQAVAGWLEKPLDERAMFEALERVVAAREERSRVLVVDDDLALAQVLTATFERHGLEAFHAQSGAEAIELSQRVLPDLLVLDLGLPDSDGFDVVDWLRRHERLHAVPMVVYTARDLTAEDRERLRLGAETEFLTKGRISPEQFEQRVMELLGRILRRREEAAEHGAQANTGSR